MADNGSIVVLLDEFSLLARETARNEVDITLEDALMSSSVNIPIFVETDKILEDAISPSTNYVKLEVTLEDTEVDNPIIGSLDFSLEDADLFSNLDISGIHLEKTLNNATLDSILEASGITLVKTLDKAFLFSSVIATGGSLIVTLDNFNLESQAISDNQVNVSIILEEISKSIEANLLVQSQLEKSLEDTSISSSYSTNVVATLVKDLEELTVDSDIKGTVFFPAEISFGDVVSSAEGYLLSGLLSPYQDFATWTGHPATGQSLKVRIGNLKGITNLDEFGLFASSGWNLASQGTVDEENIPDSASHLIASNRGVRAYNMDITLFDGGAPVIELNHSVPSFALGSTLPSGYSSGEGIWMGKDIDNIYKFRVGGTGDQDNSIRYDGSALEIRGAEFIQYNLSIPVISLNPENPSLAIGNGVPVGFSEGIGLWAGIDEGQFKFRLGDPINARLEWLTESGELNLYGTSLTFDGEKGFIILSQTSLYKDASGSFIGSGIYIDSKGISGVNLNQEQVRIDSQTGEIIAAGIHLNSSGISMLGGTFTVGQATSFTSGIGVFIGELPSDLLVSESLGDYIYSEGSLLGYNGTDEFRVALGGGWAFRIGDPAGDRLEWNGSNLNLYAPVINLIKGISDPTLYFKESNGNVLFDINALDNGTNTLATLKVTQFTNPTKLDLIASKITVSQDPQSALEIATKQYVDNNIISDHGLLSGLTDDDHTQYLNNTRHDTTTRHTIGTVVPHDSQKADDSAVVHDTGDETIAGIKTFSSIPILPASDPTNDNQAVRKAYVDNNAGISLLDVYPVGAIYISVSSTSPATLFGGTWQSFGAGRVLVGIDTSDTDFDTVEETGGEKSHTLTESEMPQHTHSGPSHTHSVPSHTHTIPQHRHWQRLGAYGNSAYEAMAYGYKDGGQPDGGFYTGWGGGGNTGSWGGNTGSGGTGNTGAAGSNGAHNNLQPYIVVHMWKRTA